MAEEEEEEAEVNIGLLLTGFCLTEASKNQTLLSSATVTPLEIEALKVFMHYRLMMMLLLIPDKRVVETFRDYE